MLTAADADERAAAADTLEHHHNLTEERAFATKPELAQQMLEPTFQGGLAFAWIAGDSVYRNNRPLRQWLEQHKQPMSWLSRAKKPSGV